MSFSDREKRLGRGKVEKVSVIVPNYNYARYLRRRIISIAEQSYPIYELIILDDASTDGSKTMIKKVVAEAGRLNPEMRIRLIWNKENSGKAMSQWVKGVKEASGDYIWIAEADDASRKDFLKEAMKGFANDPEVVLSYTESAIMNGRGVVMMPSFRRSRDKERTGHFSKSYIRPGMDEITEIMAIRCTIPNVSAVVLKKTPRLIKAMKEASKYNQTGDWYLYAKLLEEGKIFYNHKSMNLFRVHRNSATDRGAVHVGEVKKMHEYFRRNYELSSEVLGWMDAELARVRQKYGVDSVED